MTRPLCALLAFVGLLVWGSIPQAQDTRQFYLSPIDGAANTETGQYSRCLGMPGYGNIDLRPWGVEAFLCTSNDLPKDMTGVQQIGASLRSALGARKGELDVTFKKVLAATNVEDLIVEVISPKLRAGKDGKLKIYLGGATPIYQQTAWIPFRDNGLVADLSNSAMGLIEPTLAWAATFTETFPGANAGVLAGDLTWTEYLSTEWERIANRADANGLTASAAEARADHDTATDDQSVQADMTYTWVSGAVFRCTVIGRKDSTTTRNFYQFGFQRDTGVDVYRLLKRSAGSPTTLGDSAGATASSATIKLVVDGTSIVGYVNGALTVGPITDASISANTRAGLAYVGGSTSDVCTADNISIADYVTPTRSKGGAIWFQ